MSNTLTGSFDDIVFEGRNQAYGAFQLRRSYQSHLGKALGIAVTACSLLLLLPIAWHLFAPAKKEVHIAPDKGVFAKPQIYVLPKAEPLQPAAAKSISVPPHAIIPIRVVPDESVKPLIPTQQPNDVGISEPTDTGIGTDTPTATGPASGRGTGTGTGTTPPSGIETGSAPAAVVYAEVMPDFVGGRTALQRYLQKHLRFPAAALAAQVSGRVYVSFVVQANGSIGDVTVLKGLGYGTEEAAARVVREMPAWTPGLQNHHAVAVRFTLPITFQFE